MNASSVDLADMIEAYGDSSGVGVTLSSTMFIGREPSTPDDCVTLFDTPGFMPQITLDQLSYYRPSVQVRVRNNDYATGWTVINNIRSALHGRAQETWNGSLYSLIVCSDPFLLGRDANERVWFVMNVEIQRRES